MTGSDHEPVVRRNLLFVMNVLKQVVPGLDPGRLNHVEGNRSASFPSQQFLHAHIECR
jgi:hypothetical protein